ncbi:MAG: Chromosomal replication initiator protein DnaA [Parcubacteria group bacterium GW2011_GWA2_51_10]|nr:MAG: Chromosomal replication initiator protein DnaA [Parcubacteria group bacterium GW2011_GWA2_51_10]
MNMRERFMSAFRKEQDAYNAQAMQGTVMSNRELWQNALVQIELGTSEASFRTWFRNTDIGGRDGSTVHVAVPSKIVKEWLIEKHHKLILKALRSLDGNIRNVEYTVHRSVLPREERKQSRPQKEENASFDLQALYIDKRDNLNPRYTFDTFVVGPFNQLAHAAAKAVLDRPGLAYNPLFIYGSTGRGKTHLIQAIGNYFKKAHANKKILYVTSERFAVDYINAVRAGRANGFKDQYRQYDVLIMDDVQFIANTEKTQEELFHLFNALHDNNKQIVFSSDKHPNFLPGFEDRLKGRFSAGMIAEIPEPDVESRVAIIKAKLEQHGFSIPEEIIGFIAESVRGNIRELEGVLNMIVCKSQLKGKGVSLADVRALVKHNVKPNKGVSVEEIVRRIAQYYEIPEKNIYEKTRKKEVVKPRQIIMYMLREEFGVSYPSIGEKLGGRDHTTVIHSCEKIKRDSKASAVLEQELEHIRALIHA